METNQLSQALICYMGIYLKTGVERYCFSMLKTLARQNRCFVKFSPIVCLDVNIAFKSAWQTQIKQKMLPSMLKIDHTEL